MTPYQVSHELGGWTVYVAIGLALAWVATGRWRDYPPTEGRTAAEVEAVVRSRTRLVKFSVLGIAALWLLANVATITWVVYHEDPVAHPPAFNRPIPLAP